MRRPFWPVGKAWTAPCIPRNDVCAWQLIRFYGHENCETQALLPTTLWLAAEKWLPIGGISVFQRISCWEWIRLQRYRKIACLPTKRGLINLNTN